MATESKKPAGSPPQSNGHGCPLFAEDVTGQLRELGRLQPDWDGYGAPVIDPAIIQAACTFVTSLPADVVTQPRIVPMSGGNLQLEWHRGPKVLELEFETPQTIRYLQWDPESDVEEETVFAATELDSAIELIDWFQARASA